MVEVLTDVEVVVATQTVQTTLKVVGAVLVTRHVQHTAKIAHIILGV